MVRKGRVGDGGTVMASLSMSCAAASLELSSSARPLGAQNTEEAERNSGKHMTARAPALPAKPSTTP